MSQIRLDPDLTEKLRRQAGKQGRSLANLANLLLRRLLGMKPTPPMKTSLNKKTHHDASKNIG